MADWLLTHQAAVQSCLLLGSFAAVAFWESFRPRRSTTTSLGNRWFIQIVLAALGTLLARFCLPLAAFAMSVLVDKQGWGLFNHLARPPWIACALGVLLLDLGNYAQHRVYHAVPLFWRFHRIHHSDLDVDCGTAIRHHPVETLATTAFDLALIAVIGVPPLAVLLAATLSGIASVFNHGNVAMSKYVDQPMRWFIVTPDMHRIHHSVVVTESNRNFANLFSWWDHLFATYQCQPGQGHEQMELGVAEARNTGDVALGRLLLMPLRHGGGPMFSGADMSQFKSFP